MKNKPLSIVLLIALVVALFAVTAYAQTTKIANNERMTTMYTTMIPVEKVKIDASGLLLISVKKKAQVSAIVQPDNATDKTVTWTSTNTNIFTVDENGNITPHKQGTATLTAQSSNGLRSTIIVRITA